MARPQGPTEAGLDVGDLKGALELGDDGLGRPPLRLNGQDRELVSAETRDEVLAADGAAQRVGARDQAPVPGVVPLGVVDRLQAVEVEDDDDGVEAVPCAAALLSS